MQKKLKINHYGTDLFLILVSPQLGRMSKVVRGKLSMAATLSIFRSMTTDHN